MVEAPPVAASIHGSQRKSSTNAVTLCTPKHTCSSWKFVQAPSNHEVGWNANCSAQSETRLCPILHNFSESIPVGHANSIYRLPTSLDNLDPIEHFALISGLFPCSFFDRTTILPMASGGIIDCQSLFPPPIIGSGLAKIAFVPASLHSWKQLLFLSIVFLSFPAISHNSTRTSVKNCPWPWL